MSPPSRRVQWIALIAGLVATAAMFVAFAERLPIEGTSLAVDWKAIWAAIEGGNPRYLEEGALRIPPWNVFPLLPLGLLTVRASWGLLIQLTMIVLVASVPRGERRWLYWIAVVLLVTSYPTLRTVADGNVDGMVVLGCLVLLYGYRHGRPLVTAAGVLLATMKPQVSFLLVAAVGLCVLRTWPKKAWLRVGLPVLAVVTLTMLWRGQEWLATVYGVNYQRYTGTLIDISISATLARIGNIPGVVSGLLRASMAGVTLWAALKDRQPLTSDKAGLLIAASLLTAPYATGNSLMVLLAIGIMPLFLSRPLIGGMIVALADLPFLYTSEMLQSQAYHWTIVVLFAWAALLWKACANEPAESPHPGQSCVPGRLAGTVEPLGPNDASGAGT